MKSFAVDVYLWHPEFRDWLWVPEAGSEVRWPAFPGISQDDLLSSDASMVFRIDNVLLLGHERDSFPIGVWIRVLADSLRSGEPHEQLARLAGGENLAFEIRQGLDGHSLSISRYSTREPGDDYLEKTAIATGCYYRDVAVPTQLWRAAVCRALAGLRDALRAAPPPVPGPEQAQLANFIEKLPLAAVCGNRVP